MSERLLWVMPSAFVGGPERQTLLAARTLRSMEGIQSHFLVMPPRNRAGGLGTFLELARGEGFTAEEFVHDGRYALWRARRALRARVVEIQPKWILSLGYKANFLTASFRDVPAASYIHGFTGADAKVRLFEWLQRRALLRRHAGVAVISEAQKRELSRLGIDAVRVPNAWDPARKLEFEDRATLRKSWGLGENDPVIGCVGRLSPEKGQAFLIESFPALKQRHAGLKLVLVGDGLERDSLEALSRSKGVERDILFLGFRADAFRLLKGFDVLVVPSLTEGLPEVVFEAFAAEVPVVGARVGGIPEQLGRGESAGWGFRALDEASLQEGLEGALSDRRDGRVATAKATLESGWSPQSQAQSLLKLLRSLER